ncbi:MAG: hypothetical protein ACK415_12085, partial [Thermodesulfovibrionales bacterium]
ESLDKKTKTIPQKRKGTISIGDFIRAIRMMKDKRITIFDNGWRSCKKPCFLDDLSLKTVSSIMESIFCSVLSIKPSAGLDTFTIFFSDRLNQSGIMVDLYSRFGKYLKYL